MGLATTVLESPGGDTQISGLNHQLGLPGCMVNGIMISLSIDATAASQARLTRIHRVAATSVLRQISSYRIAGRLKSSGGDNTDSTGRCQVEI
jgi:hypothetical protein